MFVDYATLSLFGLVLFLAGSYLGFKITLTGFHSLVAKGKLRIEDRRLYYDGKDIS
jgi:hypothetical protein